VAAKLDESPDLSPRERAVLALVFSLAGEAAAEHTDEVTGFMPTAVENVLLGPGALGPSANPALKISITDSFTKAFGDGSVRPTGLTAPGATAHG
jgi:hypothetical protein